MPQQFTESIVEDAALAWLESLGYTIKHGPEIAPGELFAERENYAQAVLAAGLMATRAKNATVQSRAILGEGNRFQTGNRSTRPVEVFEPRTQVGSYRGLLGC